MSLIPILVIDINTIRQKQVLPHPSFELIPFTKVWHESQKIERPPDDDSIIFESEVAGAFEG